MEILALMGGVGLYYVVTDSKKTSRGSGNKFDVLQYRNPNSYSKSTKDLINLVTIQEDINPVGSQKFKVARYPGDIDIMEPIKECCSETGVINGVAKSIKKIAQIIRDTPKVYLGDFKAGLDDRYGIDIGEVNAYDKVIGYNRESVIEALDNLYDLNLLNSDELGQAFNLITKRFSRKSWEKLQKFVKKYHVVRWNLDELISGKKQIGPENNSITLTLKDALKVETITKLDLWAKVDGRYTEITNFFLMSYYDSEGNENPISPPLTGYNERIIKDLKHYGQGTYYQPLKMAKRLWALAEHLL